MKNAALWTWLLVAVLSAHAAAITGEPGAANRANQVLVMVRAPVPHYAPGAPNGLGYGSAGGRMRAGKVADAIARNHGLAVIEGWPMPALGVHCFLLEARHQDLAALMARLTADPRVESVQALQTFRTVAAPDPFVRMQADANGIDLTALHAVATGRGVRVAQIDTGVDLDHPDLVDQIDDVRNFVDVATVPAERHGTAVAGIIAARAGDGIGMSGIAPGARLLVLRACWEQRTSAPGACNSFTLAKALQYALVADAEVINLSLAGPQDRLLQRLLDVALSRDIVVVGALDRQGQDAGFPASHPGVIAVVAGDAASPPHADLAAVTAPGRDILTTLPGGRWGFMSGGSIATAHISALAALIIDLAPKLTAGDVADLLKQHHYRESGNHVSKLDTCGAVTAVAGLRACPH